MSQSTFLHSTDRARSRARHEERASSTRASGFAAALILAAMALGACTAYEPKPLDLAATREQWLARSADAESVRGFAARLAEIEPARPAFEPADGLSLAEAEAVAVVFNRELRVMRRAASVAAATADYAGIWEDPVLGIELEKIVNNVPNPWIVGATVGITIPISGRLDAAQDLADRALAAELERIAAREWIVRMDVRSTWVEWSSQRLRVDVLEDVLRESEGVASLAAKLEEGGVLARIDGRLFPLEVASRRAELVLATARTRELELQLRDLLGLAPAAPVAFVPQVALSSAFDDFGAPSTSATLSAAPGSSSLRAEFEERSLELAAARREYDVAEAELALEVRKQYPDLTIGPGYKSDQGDSRVLLGLSLPMPLWNRNQQGVAEALARRDRAREEFDALYEHLVSRLEVAIVRASGARAARESLERELLPMIDLQDDELRRSADLGRIDPLLTLETLRSRYDAGLRAIDARAAESIAIAEIDALVGPPRPPPLPPASASGVAP